MRHDERVPRLYSCSCECLRVSKVPVSLLPHDPIGNQVAIIVVLAKVKLGMSQQDGNDRGMATIRRKMGHGSTRIGPDASKGLWRAQGRRGKPFREDGATTTSAKANGRGALFWADLPGPGLDRCAARG